jgi:glycolate oxidase
LLKFRDEAHSVADHCSLPTGVVAELQSLLGAEQVLTEPIDLIPYGFDGTATLKERPGAVVLARTTTDVAAIVALAHRHRIPMVARGSGTGLSGGSVPVPGCLVIGLNQLDAILEVDPKNLTILVETGVITQRIDEEAAKHGLFYPPDPGSQKISTIGGNVAENSGGLRGLKYGVTRDYVMGMEVILADGEVVWLGNQCVKDVAGYSIKDLFIGSEGTLGIITKVLLKLLPRPSARRTLLATFDQLDQGAQTVSDIIAAKIIPCTLEFLDQTTIRCVEDFSKAGLPVNAGSLVLMETDGAESVVVDECERMMALAKANGATDVRVAANEAEAARLAAARRSAFAALARVKPTTILEDVTVPRSHLAAMVRFIAETADKHQLQIATFGHLGDGNLHPTILTDERDTEEMVRVEYAIEDIVRKALAFKGTITGEHGVGLAKKAFLKEQLGDASFNLMKRVKKALDPKGLLNPGKIFD